MNNQNKQKCLSIQNKKDSHIGYLALDKIIMHSMASMHTGCNKQTQQTN